VGVAIFDADDGARITARRQRDVHQETRQPPSRHAGGRRRTCGGGSGRWRHRRRCYPHRWLARGLPRQLAAYIRGSRAPE
jgi:hypothetical protein